MRDLTFLLVTLRNAFADAHTLVMVLEGNHERLIAVLPAPDARTLAQRVAIKQSHDMMMDAAVRFDAASAALRHAEEEVRQHTRREPTPLECEIDNLEWEIDELEAAIEIDGENGRRQAVADHRARLAVLLEELDERRR